MDSELPTSNRPIVPEERAPGEEWMGVGVPRLSIVGGLEEDGCDGARREIMCDL